MDMPKITIITVTYNSENTIEDTFNSIKKQKYPNLEYIVIDGGSKDATLSIAEKYSDMITSLTSEPDNGISDAMNKGISKATGDIIGIIHSDDMLCDGALEKLAKEYDPKVDVYFGNAIICDTDGNAMHGLKPQLDLSKFTYEFCLIHPSTFVKKEAYSKYGVYDTSLKCSMDYDMFLRLYLNNATFKYIDFDFTRIRMGGTNQKYRRKTIDEVCHISIKHGGKKAKAKLIKYKKITKDHLRPFANALHITNKRRKKL